MVAVVGLTPRASSLLCGWVVAVVYYGVHTDVGRYLGPTRNGAADLGRDLELV